MVTTPDRDGLDDAVAALHTWQRDDAPAQLHSGDIGWFWRFGAETTAAAVRTWSRGGRIVAVGLLDGADLLRMTVAPDAFGDEELTREIVDDIDDPSHAVLPAGPVSVECPRAAAVHDLLRERAWTPGERWTPLRRDLAAPVEDPGIRIEVVGPEQVRDRVTVQRAAFAKSTFTEQRWHTMAAGGPYAEARCLVAYDGRDDAVAALTVWSAGRGRRGLLEPVGVHPDHRGKGYGTAISIAGAAALRDLGSSSAFVCTRSANVAAVATYASAGYEPLPEIGDLCRTSA